MVNFQKYIIFTLSIFYYVFPYNKSLDIITTNDMHGFISTCNSTNLFFIKNNEIITSKGKYCLNGITRSKTIEICKKNNISCHEKKFTFEDISDCEEAFVTGTFGGIVPVSTLENQPLQSTNKESITNKIRTLYLQDIENYIKSRL